MSDEAMPDSNPPANASDGQPAPASYDASAEHHRRPKLRPVRGFATKAAGPDGEARPVLGLADSKQISDKIVFTQPAMQAVLPLLDGENELDTIVTQVGRGLTREMLEQLVAQLDSAGLIEGPVFEGLYAKLRSDFDGSEVLPPGQTAAFADHLVMQLVANEAGQAALGEGKSQEEAQAAAKAAAEGLGDEEKSSRSADALRSAFDQWMNAVAEKVEDPSFDALPRAVFVPFSPYMQGWQNYAHVYARLRVVDRPDRIVVLGTNHFGMATGVCAVDKSFATPLGESPCDLAMLGAVREQLEGIEAGLGEALLAHKYDHEREHSVELQIPWLQHVFGGGEGQVPVFAALVHDPVVNNGESYDGEGVSLEAFCAAMRGALEGLGGRTLIVASHELSHVGSAFGDQQPYAAQSDEGNQARQSLIQQDQSLVSMLAKGQTDELITSLSWQQNPTRWNSTGALIAAIESAGGVGEEGAFRIHNFAGIADQAGHALVTSVAASLA